MALFAFIGLVEVDTGDFGELLAQNLLRDVENDLAAFACDDAAEHFHMADRLVEVRVMRDRVAEIHADRFVDLAGAGVALLHELLHALQAERERAGVDAGHFILKTGGADQTGDRLLREVVRADAEAAPIFKEIAKQWGIPLRLENDGDVTALAGSISLGDGAVLGLAMGSSLAGGYVDDKRAIKGWMNELAFAPVDYNPLAATDEWSRDFGVGANYFSQQAVARLIGPAGLESEMAGIDAGAFPLRLKRVQELMEKGDARARKIYETIGVYLGYTVAHYADFYKPIRHVEVLGRVVTGEGGQIILSIAKKILADEFPELKGINFYEPDEREKRHGQAAAAASLPLTK